MARQRKGAAVVGDGACPPTRPGKTPAWIVDLLLEKFLWELATGRNAAGEPVSELLHRVVCDMLRERESRRPVTYALDLGGSVRAPVTGRARMDWPALSAPQ